MGYYVQSIDNDFFLDKKYFDDVYNKMCELNDYHDLKRGGSFGSNTDPIEGERYPRNKWFSWMDYNYPETCDDLFEILTRVGFEWAIDDDGNMYNLRYAYEKTGSEDYFLTCFAPFVRDGSFIEFQGEDYDHWKYVFENGKMTYYKGRVEVIYEAVETYEFGKLSQDDIALALWREKYMKEMAEQKAAQALEN